MNINFYSKNKCYIANVMAIVLSVIMVFSSVAINIDKTQAADDENTIVLKNPIIEEDSNMNAGQKVTYDCVWFGSYPQAEVVCSEKDETDCLDASVIVEGDYIVDAELYEALKDAEWNSSNDTILNGEKYHRLNQEQVLSERGVYNYISEEMYTWTNNDYHYFKYQPVKWRILSLNDNIAFLLADKCLDSRVYSYATDRVSVNWETCTMRSWLNGYDSANNDYGIDYTNSNFIDRAFGAEEKQAILSTELENEDNPYYGTDGGNNTEDRVFLLSGSELEYGNNSKSYGFVSGTHDEAKICGSSIFAKAMGASSYLDSQYLGNCWWWLRTPGYNQTCSANVAYDGGVSVYGGYVHAHYQVGVRPALYLNISDSSIWKYAGTVCSDGTVNENKISSGIKWAGEYIYRANYFLNEENVGTKGINSLLTSETPCYLLDKSAEESGLADSVVAWETVGLIFDTAEDPSKLVDFSVKPKDIYSALLMNVLETSYASKVFVGNLNDLKESTKLCDKFVSSINQLMLVKYKIDLYDVNDFKNLTDEQKLGLSNYAEEWFAIEQPDLVSIKDDVFKYFSMAFDTIESIDDYYNKIQSCLMVRNIGEDMKMVLRQAYNDCGIKNNIYLHYALEDCVEIIDSSIDEFIQKMIMEGVTTVGVNTGKWLFKNLVWKDIVKKFYAIHPETAVLMAVYKGVSLGVNQLFSTDKISEQYLNMNAMEDIENLFKISSNNLKFKFKEKQNEVYARAYISSLALICNALNEDCNQAYKFVDVVDNTAINNIAKMFNCNNDMSEVKAKIKSIQKLYQSQYDTSSKMWILNLADDFPGSGLYEYYDNLYNGDSDISLQKQVSVACPVNVYVYNENNDLVASAVDGVVNCSDDYISVIGVGDEKTFLFYDNKDYSIRYVGSDNGAMDIEIDEFGENEDNIRTVNYYNVNLTTGLTYEMPVEAENSVESAYEMTNVSEASVIACNYDSMAENSTYRATVINGSMNYNNGMFFETDVNSGQNVEIHAYIPDGYRFVKWESSTSENIFQDMYSADTMFVMPDYDCELKAVIEENPVVFSKHSITLADEIGVNFSMIVPEYAREEGAYIEFSISGKDKNITTIPVEKAVVLDDGRLRFTYYVNSIQMADTITATYHYGEDETVTENYSVKDYIEAIVSSDQMDDKTKNLAKKLADYGYYAQLCLSETNGWVIGTDHEQMIHYNDCIDTSIDLSAYSYEQSGETEGIIKVNKTLNLDSKTAIMLLFTVDDTYNKVPNIIVTDVDGNEVDVQITKQSDGRYCLLISGISAHKLGDVFTVVVDGTMTIKISAMSYANAVILSDSMSDSSKVAVAALYEYFSAAIEYKLQ